MKKISLLLATVFAIALGQSAVVFGASCLWGTEQPKLEQALKSQVNQWAKQEGATSFALSFPGTAGGVTDATFSFVAKSGQTFNGILRINELTCSVIDFTVRSTRDIMVQ